MSVFGVQAFATAWAGAISCGPDCYVNDVSAASAIGEVSATAVASAYSALCDGASARSLVLYIIVVLACHVPATSGCCYCLPMKYDETVLASKKKSNV